MRINKIMPAFVAMGLLILPLLTGAAEPVSRGTAASFFRFRVDQFPEGPSNLTIMAIMKVHHSPWTLSNLKLTPEPVTKTGWTPWLNLAGFPGGAKGSLILTLPVSAKGVTRFSRYADEGDPVRDIDWTEPDGTKIIVTPDFSDVRTFREQERRYYLRTLQQTGGHLFPLSRPPLFFGNAWGYTTGGAAEYMVKSFRLMGLNSVVTSEDVAKYETLYGWHSQGGQYGPPGFMPYDEAISRAQFGAFYSNFFATGKGKGSAPGMRIFQLADEPGEAAPNPKDALPAFRQWLTEKGLNPGLFGKSTWDEVGLLLKDPKTPEDNRLYYWSQKYQDYLTPKMFALAAEAVRKAAPNQDVLSYVALSGHALYFPSKMPVDMFQLAQYPGLMPGISDWMTSGSWNWDSHQAVAFSVAPFNAGARRYGADFGKPPISFPMMHCVNPSFFRAYTQLGNQCKFISYYNYGPDYEVTEGFWSPSWSGQAVQQIDNQAAQMDDILGPGVMRPSRVAMLYATSQDIWWPQWSFVDKRGTFLALSHSYYQPELVSEEQIAAGALAHYDALYVLDSVVPRATQDRIVSWVKNGGLLWSCAEAGVVDEYKESCDLLYRVGGLKRDNSVAQTQLVQIVPVKGETSFTAHQVPPLGRAREVIRPGVFTWPGVKIRATYSDGNPAWAEKKVGKGKLVYLGHRAGMAYGRSAGARGEFKWWPDGGQRQLLYVPLVEAKIEPELSVSGPLVMASPISTDAGTVIILFNMFPEDQTNLTVTLKEPARPQSVQWCGGNPELTALPYEYADGRLVIRNLNLPKRGTMILVRRKPAPADDRLVVMRATAEKGLASTDWQAASAGAWFAGFYPDWNLAPQVLPLLNHEHWAVRRSAAEALGRLGHKPAAAALRAALARETDTHALADELYALTLLDPREAKKLFSKYRKHADIFVRQEVERAAALVPEKK
jgi:hypothetical protein